MAWLICWIKSTRDIDFPTESSDSTSESKDRSDGIKVISINNALKIPKAENIPKVLIVVIRKNKRDKNP